MERLALVTTGEVQLQREVASVPRRRGASFRSLLWFGLGALASGAIGGFAFLGLRALAAAEMGVDQSARVAPERETPPQIVDLAVARSERARAPLALEVRGTDDSDVEILLQGVPPAARLSRGERRDARTWMLRRADLDGLYLTLGDAAPDAFEMHIDVLASPGVETQGSVVRVRLLDTASPERTAAETGSHAPPGEAATTVTSIARPETVIAKRAPPHRPGASRGSGVDEAKVARQPSAQPRAAPAAGAGAAALRATARPWSEGASALGAISRPSERQVWWNMPPPSWSPFHPAGTN